MYSYIERQGVFGITRHSSEEIAANSAKLLAFKATFVSNFAVWYEGLNPNDSHNAEALADDFFVCIVSGEYDQKFYSSIYKQALTWASDNHDINNALIMLSHFRNQFIDLIIELKCRFLAKSLCNVFDLAESIIEDVISLYDIRANLVSTMQDEKDRLCRSFHLIGAQTPEALLDAYFDHLNWKVLAYSCALDEVITGNFPYSPNASLLGKWLASGGRDQIEEGNHLLFTHAHEQVHQLGMRALVLAKEHHPEKVAEFLKEMDEASEVVSKQLLQCIDEVFQRSAQLDFLTGLPNRKAFDNKLTFHLSMAKRYRFWMGLIIIDTDHFKMINDSKGHAYGDLVLKELADLIDAIVRHEDSVFRWGGEEFTVLTLDKSKDGIVTLAERIRMGVECHPFCVDHGDPYGLTVSCGAVSFPASLDIEDDKVFKEADAELYKAKEGGRNRVSFKTLEQE